MSIILYISSIILALNVRAKECARWREFKICQTNPFRQLNARTHLQSIAWYTRWCILYVYLMKWNTGNQAWKRIFQINKRQVSTEEWLKRTRPKESVRVKKRMWEINNYTSIIRNKGGKCGKALGTEIEHHRRINIA